MRSVSDNVVKKLFDDPDVIIPVAVLIAPPNPPPVPLVDLKALISLALTIVSSPLRR